MDLNKNGTENCFDYWLLKGYWLWAGHGISEKELPSYCHMSQSRKGNRFGEDIRAAQAISCYQVHIKFKVYQSLEILINKIYVNSFFDLIFIIYTISLDVASSESISRCLEAVKEKGVKKIDVLVNNAGVSNKNHPDDASTDVDRYS